MTSKTKLWAAQVREYPTSKRLTIAQIYLWCDSGDYDTRLAKYMRISTALQYPNVVWYEIPGTPYRGFRFGEQGYQYVAVGM